MLRELLEDLCRIKLQKWVKPPAAPEKEERNRRAWMMRQDGMTYRAISNEIGTGLERTRQIIMRYERIIQHDCNAKLGAHVSDKCYGIWHTFTHEGRQTHV